MADAKNVLAIAISVAVLALVVENVPVIKSNVEDFLSGVSISPAKSGTTGFPVKLDAGSLSSSFTVQVDDVASVSSHSSGASVLFDDRQITINPSLLEDMVFESYSGKLVYDPTEGMIRFEGAAKSFASGTITLKSERKVRILGNLTSGTAMLSKVAGGTIMISKASGNLVYNATNSLSLLGEDAKITNFNGDVSIGSLGIVVDGTASHVEVKGGGKTVSYG
ncbi:MAG: hypothetical protein HY516_04810 [Candidatus Aenigmarchaeota archaeon]|nr:hypothetical protein [Candidatus Aenigmarchaeota archaeon]